MTRVVSAATAHFLDPFICSSRRGLYLESAGSEGPRAHGLCMAATSARSSWRKKAVRMLLVLTAPIRLCRPVPSQTTLSQLQAQVEGEGRRMRGVQQALASPDVDILVFNQTMHIWGHGGGARMGHPPQRSQSSRQLSGSKR